MDTKSKLNSNITNFIEIKRENRYPSVKSCRKKKYYIKSTQTVWTKKKKKKKKK